MTETAIGIRVATMSDIPAMSELMREQARRFAAADCTPAGLEMLLESLGEDAIRERMQGAYRHWVAEDDGGLVGLIALREPSHLFHLFVAEGRRGSGIGLMLWQHFLGEVTAGVRQPVEITVRSTSFAKRFYERIGFAAAGAQLSENGLSSYPMVFLHRDFPAHDGSAT